MAANAA